MTDSANQREGVRPVTTTRGYAKGNLHLYQAVRHRPSPGEDLKTWVVTSLDDGVTLKSPDFQEKIEYGQTSIPETPLYPQEARTGVPVFGY